MAAMAAGQIEAIDFALAAYRQDDEWHLAEISETACESIEVLAHGLRRLPGEGGVIAMIAMDEDFFVLVRTSGSQTQVLLSDISAATEWELAQSAADFLGLPFEHEEEQAPAGDLALLADLGMPAIDMAVMLDDADLYPDEMLSDIARRLGFGPEFDAIVGLDSV